MRIITASLLAGAAVAGCGGGGQGALTAKGGKLPWLSTRCGAREGAHKVFLMGASFGGVASMVAGSWLGSKIAGVLSASGRKGAPEPLGGPASELDALSAVPKLRVPFLILDALEDGFLVPADARKLERRAGSAHKRLVIFPGGYHGWDLLTVAPYHARGAVS